MQDNRMVGAISILTGALVALLAIGAFILSYDALRELAGQNGVDNWRAYIWPLLIDFSLVVFSLAVVRASLRGEGTIWPWMLVGLYTVLTVTFNVLHAPDNLMARAIAAIAPVSLFLSFELLMGQLRQEVERRARGQGDKGQGSRGAGEQGGKAVVKEPVKNGAKSRGSIVLRRARVSELIEAGQTIPQIAEVLGVSPGTIKGDKRALVAELNGKGTR